MANAPTQHAKLSPSGAHRWMPCPASVPMEDGIKDRGSKYADEGTAAHELAAWTLQSDHHSAEAFLGRKTEKGWEIDEELCSNVQTYVDNILEAVGPEEWGRMLLVEQSLPIGHLTGEEDAKGTSDSVVMAFDIAELQIHDLKYGHKAVKAEGNKQLKLYALGAYEKYSIIADFDQVRVVIHQPRLSGQPSEWVISVEELLEFGEEVKASAERAWAAYAAGKENLTEDMFAPSRDTCQWCKAQAVCPAATRKAQVAILGDFDDESQPPGKPEFEAAVKRIVALCNEDIGIAMDNAEFVEGWLRAVRSAAESRMLNGEQIPGYKLVQGKQGNREWTDAEKAEAEFKSMRLTVEQMYSLKLISPTQAEKLLKSFPRRWKKLQGYIARADGKPSVAPEYDKRPALVYTPVSDDFDVILTEEPIA